MVSNVPMNYGNFGYSNSALNDDFMYNAYMNQNSAQTTQQATQGQVNFQGNSQQTAGKQGGIGLGAALLGGAAGAGAGYYFANPLKDKNTFKDSFVKSYENIAIKNSTTKTINNTKANILKKQFGIKSLKDYEIVKKAAATGDLSKLPAGLKITDKTQQGLKNAIEQAEKEFLKIAKVKITQKIQKNSGKLTGNLKNYVKQYDTNAKAFTNNSKTLSNALKNFKWKQAGKWGAIAAGVVLAGKWALGLFQKNKQA